MRAHTLFAAVCLAPLWGCAAVHDAPEHEDTASAELGSTGIGVWDSERDPAGDDTGGTCPHGPPGMVARAQAFPARGAVPLSVDFESKASQGTQARARWDLGDGAKATGGRVRHTYLSAGSYTVVLSLQDRFGQRVRDTLVMDVAPATCPSVGQAQVLGEVEHEGVNEASGVVDSRMNPGVIWVHNDSGDGPFLYALSHTGEHLGTYELLDASARDWEDLAAGQDPESGEHLLYIGDIGDNSETRESVVVYRVPEPRVLASGGEQGGTLSGATLELVYPDGLAHNAETLMVDPVTDTIYVVTKSYGGTTGIFSKPPPHLHGERATLEERAWLDFASSPLSGNATTGGAFSPLGDRLVIRTYGSTAYMWLRDGADTMEQVLAKEPCALSLPWERQAESLAFSVAGDALLSISEGPQAPINWIPLER